MKAILFLSLLLVQLPAAEPERVIILVNTEDTKPVDTLLKAGWVVKHQSVAMAPYDGFARSYHSLIVFTLVPPAPEVTAAAQAKKEADTKALAAKRRAEWLAKQPKVEK